MLLVNKLIENIPHNRNDKKHYQSFIKNKNPKSVKKSEIITYQPKTFDNSDIVYIKSVITEHLKTSHKLSETISHAEKVGSSSSLYSDTKMVKIVYTENMLKGYNENMLLKVLQVLNILKFHILLNLNYNLKILNLQLK